MIFFGKKFCALFLLGLSALFWGCSDEESSVDILPPSQYPVFSLFPNDYAQNDSAAANLAHGINLMVHPKATYQLSFDIDSHFDAPELQLFRKVFNADQTSVYFKQVRSLEPKVVAGRYVYEFLCEESDATEWVTTLALDGDYFPGKVSNVRLTGNGAYSDHFSINLIVVGDVDEELEDDDNDEETESTQKKGFTIDELAENMLKSFRHHYSYVTIDTLYIKRAHEHPTLGKKYPKDKPWISDPQSEDMMLSELGGWPGSENALDIVLVHYIKATGILGYSDIFSGNMGGGYGSTVLLGSHYFSPYGTIENVLMKDIIETAVHETGHFFGLRHTTATVADLNQSNGSMDFSDYSNLEDGIEDTPYCQEAQLRGLLKNAASDVHKPGLQYRIRLFEKKSGSFDIRDCPDANNMMFPTALDNIELSFSKQQMELIRKSLMIFPH